MKVETAQALSMVSSGLDKRTCSLHACRGASRSLHVCSVLTQIYKAGSIAVHILKIRKLTLCSQMTCLSSLSRRVAERGQEPEGTSLLSPHSHPMPCPASSQEELWLEVSPASDRVQFLALWSCLMFLAGRVSPLSLSRSLSK